MTDQQVLSEWQHFVDIHKEGMDALRRFSFSMTGPLTHVEQFLDLIAGKEAPNRVQGDAEAA